MGLAKVRRCELALTDYSVITPIALPETFHSHTEPATTNINTQRKLSTLQAARSSQFLLPWN